MDKLIRMTSILQIGVMIEDLIETAENDAEAFEWSMHLETWNNCWHAAADHSKLEDNPYVWDGHYVSDAETEDSD